MKIASPPKAKKVPRKCPAFAPGKIILTGEYAVVFGHPGIAIPAPIGMEVLFEEDPAAPTLGVTWEGIHGDTKWKSYLRTVVHHCKELSTSTGGRLTVRSALPLGKGMGSSTALVIAVARAMLGKHPASGVNEPQLRETALSIEDAVNPGHSGIDFAVIWNGKPVRFVKGQPPQLIDLTANLLANAVLIDTGTPNETTPELVEWVRSRLSASRSGGSVTPDVVDHRNSGSRTRAAEIRDALETIGICTRRLEAGEDLTAILRDHHRAQVALGVVPPAVQELIAAIEAAGGVAKVLGAGARTGGGGMILATHKNPSIPREIARKHGYPNFLAS